MRRPHVRRTRERARAAGGHPRASRPRRAPALRHARRRRGRRQDEPRRRVPRAGRCRAGALVAGPVPIVRPREHLSAARRRSSGPASSSAPTTRPRSRPNAWGTATTCARCSGSRPRRELQPWEAKTRLTQAWIAFLEELAQDGPVVVVVEDVHWAEDPLLELLAVTAREASGPLLLLATARPELTGRAQPWSEGNANVSRIWLEPLSRDEAERMLDELAGGLPASGQGGDPAARRGQPVLRRGGAAVLGRPGRCSAAPRAARPPSTFPAGSTCPRPSRPSSPRASTCCPRSRSTRCRPHRWSGGRSGRARCASWWPRRRRASSCSRQRDFVRRRRRSSLEAEREHLFKHELTRDVAYRSLPTRQARAAACGLRRVARAPRRRHRPARRAARAPLRRGGRAGVCRGRLGPGPERPRGASRAAPSAGCAAPASRRATVTR